MKKIYFIGALCAAALGMTSCSETWDDAPVLNTHEGVPVVNFLNEPQMKEAQVMITEKNNTSNFNLTCSQPDFGYAAAAAYQVQMSLTEDFADFREIAQRYYDCAQINPLYSDVASALEELSGVRSEADLPLPYQKVYMRLKAFIPQSPENTTYLSNVVSYNAISASYLAIWVADVPVNIYLRGELDGASWDDCVPQYQFVTGEDKDTWIVRNVTIQPGKAFKIADNSWGSINLGAPGDDEPVEVEIGKSFKLVASGKNLTVKDEFHGSILLTLTDGNYSATFTPTE